MELAKLSRYFFNESFSMTYYLRESEWYQSVNVPEGMNLDMINQPGRLSALMIPSINELDTNKIFIDLGCGTGALGLQALRNGAKFVYFVERDAQMFHIIQNVLPKKIDAAKFKLINKDIEDLTSADFDHGTPDYVVSEFFGPRLFDEGYVNYTKHIRSMFPLCRFIPEEFVVEFYYADIDYSQPIWPSDPDLIDHYKFMYKSKGFSRHIDTPNNLAPIGTITFNANTQEFKNSLEFKITDKDEKIIYGKMLIRNSTFEQYYSSIGWLIDQTDYGKNMKLYFDIQDFFNPRFIQEEII